MRTQQSCQCRCTAAYHAARRADAVDKDRIRRRFDAMEKLHGAGDVAAEAHADAAFHLAIAHASRNAVLTHVMSSLFGLLHTSISQALRQQRHLR